MSAVSGWLTRAACLGEDTTIFFTTGTPPPRVRRLCESCPVQPECLEDMLELGEDQYGYGGGMTAKQRREVWFTRRPIARWADTTVRHDEVVSLHKAGLSVPRIAQHMGEVSEERVRADIAELRRQGRIADKPTLPPLPPQPLPADRRDPTSRRAAVLPLVEQGYSPKQIAEALNIPYWAVKYAIEGSWRTRRTGDATTTDNQQPRQHATV